MCSIDSILPKPVLPFRKSWNQTDPSGFPTVKNAPWICVIFEHREIGQISKNKVIKRDPQDGSIASHWFGWIRPICGSWFLSHMYFERRDGRDLLWIWCLWPVGRWKFFQHWRQSKWETWWISDFREAAAVMPLPGVFVLTTEDRRGVPLHYVDDKYKYQWHKHDK